MAERDAPAISRDGVPDRRYFRTPATAPGPSGPQMLRRLQFIRKDPLGFLQRMTAEYGPVVQFPIPSPPSYLVADPAAVRRVLVDRARDYDKATVQYRSLSMVTGEGLLTTSGEVWRRQRRMVQPAFHRAGLEAVVGHAIAGSQLLLARWGEVSRGAVVDIDEAMMRVALETVGASLFGTDLSADADRLARATLQALDVVVASAQVPVRLPAWSPSQRRLQAALVDLDRAVDHMIEARLADPRPPVDLLGMLLAAMLGDDPIPRREVRDELVAFMVAGHETAASALTWVLWLLAGDEGAQDRAAAEAAAVLGGRAPTYDDLDRLPYLRAVVDEAMRLYPPVWLVSRRALVDDVLGGREIPAGSLLIMTPYLAQRDASVWPEPTRFDPERFLGGRGAGSSSTGGASTGASPARGGLGSARGDASLARGGRAQADAEYWPFGLGPRMCVGKDFAYVEAISVLAVLLQRVRVGRVPGEPDPHAVPLVTLRPEGRLPLVIRPR